jgi:hypothetical protein
MKRVITAAMILAALTATPAQAACWTQDEVGAAKVRDMETMLMVSALRCRSSGHDFLGRYNSFVKSGRAALTLVNDRLRGHFESEVGPKRALDAYDSYVTAIANRYGAGADGLSCRDLASIASAAASEGGSVAGLVRLADNADVHPPLKGRVCPVTVAQAR